MEETVRISKLLSERGVCSRREADRLITAKQVLLNGQIVSELGTKCLPTDELTLRPFAQKMQQEKVTLILNKPVGFVSCQPEKGYREAKELLVAEAQLIGPDNKRWESYHLKKLSVCGRLDIDSKGLLVFTQDGVIAKQLIGQDSAIEKEYLVAYQGEATPQALNLLRFGLELDGKPLKRAEVKLKRPGLLSITLREGRKRQIRRCMDMVGLQVLSLIRIRVGRVLLGTLPLGHFRFLGPNEFFG